MKMKQSLLLICLGFFALASCKKEEVPAIVNVSLDFTLAESGSMTKASANPFDIIYDDLIQTRKITPTHYTLYFTLEGKTDPAIKHSGVWQNNEMFALPVGTYKVEGRSEGTSADRADTLALSFNTTVTISANTQKITLKADYASCMLIFDAGSIDEAHITNSMWSHNVAISEKHKDYYFCCFDIENADWSQGELWNDRRLPRRVIITKKDATQSEIYIATSGFENGKYYYYKNVEGVFELEKMDSGS